MARYAISQEGVQALRTLSAQLQDSVDETLDATFSLERQIDPLRMELGTFEQEISGVIEQNRQSLKENHKAIIELSRKISLKADEIETLISSGLGMGTAYGADSVPASAPAVRLVPNRAEPRDLVVTRFHCASDGEGHYIYDSPLEMDRYLYHNQGSADMAFLGTCGLCACVNVLRLAGVLICELEVLMFARSIGSGGEPKPVLCSRYYESPEMNGGTSPLDRQMILRYFGIDSELIQLELDPEKHIADRNMDLISSFVESGKGVILSVHATVLRDNAPSGTDDHHAVTVTSTVRDKEGKLLGFYIADSDQVGTRYYPAERVKRALTGKPMNVTRQVIR